MGWGWDKDLDRDRQGHDKIRTEPGQARIGTGQCLPTRGKVMQGKQNSCDSLELGAELETPAAQAFAFRLSHPISMKLIIMILCDEKMAVIPDADAISPKK